MPNKPVFQDPSDKEAYGLEKAVQTSWRELEKEPIDEVVRRTMCILGETSNTLLLPFFNKQYSLNVATRTVETSEGKQINNFFQIGIMLHYLTHAKNMPLSNKFASFRELWGGQEYYYAFNNRVLKPLLQTFGNEPGKFEHAAEVIGGDRIDKGEHGFMIPALPRVPVFVLLWTGDDEVGASANVLFDGSANQHMETEALVWLSVATVSELKKTVN